MPTSRPADLPLLRPFLDGALGLLSLADLEGLSLLDLARWAESPPARADLAAIAELAEARARAIAAQARVAALTRLTELCASTPEERELLTPAQRAAARETARKAAESLLKHTAPTQPKPAGAPPLRKPTRDALTVDARADRRAADTPEHARPGATPHAGSPIRQSHPRAAQPMFVRTVAPPAPGATPETRARDRARDPVASQRLRRPSPRTPGDALSLAHLRRRRQPEPDDPDSGNAAPTRGRCPST